ncbi:MAG: FecR domain-containing protein [Spirochaetales bacterium]|nr:FecR domain-containing protein [Spirochaetales bacterium]
MMTPVLDKKIFSILIIIFLITGSLFAKTVTGTITFIEGYVDLYRDGELVDWDLVDIGFGVEEFDLIETGEDGLVEIELKLPSGSRSTLAVKPGTTFYFEMLEKSGRNRTSFQMLGGSISFKVQKLTGNDTLDVHTESAVMGVRGTEFEITTSPEGGILVLCNEGAVSCKDEQGRERYSKPGSVVDKVPNKQISSYSVSTEDLGLYRNYWVSSRDKVFRSGAKVFIQGYANQYLLFEPKFSDAFSALLDAKATLERYGKESSSGNPGVLFKAKMEVSPAIIKMRSIMPIFEMVFYRLKELETYHNEGLGVGSITDDLSSTVFFNSFSGKKNNISRQLAEVRYLFKLYNNLHNAAGGGPSILESPLGGSGVPSGNPPVSSPFGN